MSKFNYTDCINDHFREESCVEKPLTIDENPTIIDKILFKFKTTKSGDTCDYCCDDTADNYCEDDCLDPFTFDDITIYYIERNFSNKNTYLSDDTLFHYSDATVVFKIGSPLWVNNVLECPTEEEIGKYHRSSSSNPNLSKIVSCPNPDDQLGYKRTSKDEQDPNNLLIKKIDGKIGCFEFVWTPEGVREGDYFICWTYTPYKGASKISNHLKFYLGSSTAINTSTLLHRTNPQKYIDLLERYIPEMFKEYISDNDLTPNVLEKLNKSLAKGFNVLEDLTNQIVDLLDSNSVNEYIIYYLSNTLNLNLKSNDPTLWRRQIKEAVPLFKKKGTLGSLSESFDQSGMRLLRVLNYWQVVSPFYYVDSFISKSGVDTFELTKNLVGDEIDVYLSTPKNEKKLSSDDFTLIKEEYSTKIILNNIQTTNYILRVEYCYKLPNNDFEKDIAKYIKSLPLMDSREQYVSENPIYPLKNWNIKLIEENDPYIDHIIKTRHPFTDSVIFGKIRTEFPYSENIYNMDQYNGSIRDSKSPCDIDKDFLDTCTSCRSSNFDVDLEIQNLCDDRIMEAREIISESTPFHSVLRTVNYFGGNNEYFVTPIENYEILMTFKYSENNISGGLQRWFHRSRLTDDLFQRDDLSDKTLLFNSNISIYNEKICLFSPDFNFNVIPPNSLIEILTPSIYNGTYTIFNPNNNYVDTNFSNYVNNSTFVFNIFKELYSFSANLVRDDYVELLEEDPLIDFFKLKIDTSNLISIDSDVYEIKDVSPNKIILKNSNNKINKSFNTKYKVLKSDQTVLNLRPNIDSSIAKITYQNRTRVDKFLEIKYKNNYDLKLTFTKNSTNYSCPITEYDNEGFYISNYYGEDVGSLSMKVLNYITKNQIGNFKYNGIKCSLSTPLDNYFLQNYNEYAIKITSQNFLNNYYFIYDVKTNGVANYTLSLFGDFEDFGLESNKISCTCSFYKYKNNTMTIKEQNRNLDEIEAEITRANFGVIEKQTEIKCEGKTNNTNENQLLNVSKNNGPTEASIQKENISVIIQDINGEENEVNL
jgi:P2-related tail formation protein